MTRRNHDHRIEVNTLEDIIEFFSSVPINNDRKYMKNEIMPHLTYLKWKGIKNISEITLFLKKCGFARTQMKEFIIYFDEHISNDRESNTRLFTTRQQKKSNEGEKNIVLNRMALQYPDKIIKFFKSYFDETFPNNPNRDAYVNEFKLQVKQLEDQCELNKVLVIDSIDSPLNTSYFDQQENQLDSDDGFCDYTW